MLEWKKATNGYKSACGRFRLFQTLDRASRIDGWKWTIADDKNRSNYANVRTMAKGKQVAEQWSRVQVLA